MDKKLKMSTPPPWFFRIVEKFRCIACVLALLSCSCLGGCSSSTISTSKLYLAKCETIHITEEHYYYTLYFNYNYNGDSDINLNTIEFTAKAYYDPYNFDNVKRIRSESHGRSFYVNGDNSYNISILTPKMILTLPISIDNSKIFKDEYTTNLYDKLVIELITYDENKGKILLSKTYSLKSLRQEIQSFLNKFEK